ncbi:Protein kinase superfamily protein [Forsythia ovata]|uniref:Protein kinase superfamily protein n=1 Tax=Forsythia ovata TaxID=205694 RepID=A0ABD1S7G8_9LAMI
MGCVLCKPYPVEDSKESSGERMSSKASSDLQAPRAVSSKREEGYRVKDRLDNNINDGRLVLIDKQVNDLARLRVENFEKREHHPCMGTMPRATEGEQVSAGWPPWLAAVAGEAIQGWVPRRADSFEKLDKLHKIFKLCGSPSEEYWRKSKLPHATIFKPQQPYKRRIVEAFKDFPAPALALVEILLSLDPLDRGSAASALKSEFFTTRPLPCDPSSLPKYPPSKEFDAKVRDEEARRQAAAGSKGQRHNDLERRGSRESRALPAPDANAELVSSIQKRQGQSNSKSRSEMFNSHREEVASGFPIDPPRPSQGLEEASNDPRENIHRRSSHSGPLVNRAAWVKAGENKEEASKILTGPDLSAVSGLVAARMSMLSEERREKSYSQQKFRRLLLGFLDHSRSPQIP